MLATRESWTNPVGEDGGCWQQVSWTHATGEDVQKGMTKLW